MVGVFSVHAWDHPGELCDSGEAGLGACHWQSGRIAAGAGRAMRLDGRVIWCRDAVEGYDVRWDGDFKCQLAPQLEASAGSTSQSGRQHWVEQLVPARNLKQETVLSQRKGSVAMV